MLFFSGFAELLQKRISTEFCNLFNLLNFRHGIEIGCFLKNVLQTFSNAILTVRMHFKSSQKVNFSSGSPRAIPKQRESYWKIGCACHRHQKCTPNNRRSLYFRSFLTLNWKVGREFLQVFFYRMAVVQAWEMWPRSFFPTLFGSICFLCSQKWGHENWKCCSKIGKENSAKRN